MNTEERWCDKPGIDGLNILKTERQCDSATLTTSGAFLQLCREASCKKLSTSLPFHEASFCSYLRSCCLSLETIFEGELKVMEKIRRRFKRWLPDIHGTTLLGQAGDSDAFSLERRRRGNFIEVFKLIQTSVNTWVGTSVPFILSGNWILMGTH